ncbi:Fur family ferric uptake transcriptional regulator [Cellulophaga sp. RHA19]|uniref:Fur family transcriptional regulator n=1 Tax=Cellulophaga sp. RHA19 TaxID=1798237 RepID=UPI000C2BDF38|nr:transcriptional repressor [Cellulophaga sp. RHA19]PKB42522.1 Fur family ferric uptake transcriptional regulator [Cellulophaga sp. RHA19]
MKKRRNTETKDAVLKVLENAGKALSRDAIEQKISIDINRATVYRVLNRFCEDGVLHKVVAEDGKQYFAICLNCEEKLLQEQHFHFKCTKCDTIECLHIAVNFTAPTGYAVEGVNCIVTGVCKDCT